MKKLSLFIILGLLLVGLFAFSSSAKTPKDNLIIGMDTGVIVDLDPARAYEMVTNLVIEQLYDGLVDFEGGKDAFTTIEPGLAKSWDVSEDGLTWTFHLREGAKFHSGNEVTADAVVYSFKRSLELDFAPIWMVDQFIPAPENVKKVDKYTVSITTNTPLPEGLMAAIMGIQGPCFIVDPEVAEEHSTEDDPYAYEWLQDHDAGSGPFELVEWARNERVTLRAFEDYWEGAPKLNQITIIDMPERTAQKFALDRGDIDVAWDLLPEQVDEYRDKEGFELIEQPAWQITYLAMNMGHDILGDNKVRKAIKYAIDYEAIIDGIMKGAAVKGQTFVPVGMAGHLDEIMYERDVEKAKGLLEEAGYPDGFEIQILCQPTSPRKEIATQIQNDLADVGIKANITQLVASQMYTLYRNQTHELIVAGWGIDYADAQSLTMPFAHCRTAGPEAKVRQLAWRNMAVNPELTDLVEKANKEMDQEKRIEMFKEIQQEVLEWGPFAILYYPLHQVVHKDIVEGLKIPPSESAAEWFEVYKTE